MNAKKNRTKNRRRARKLADQAWKAADDGNSDLAMKIIRRAVDLDPGNPALWHDHGLLLRLSGDESSAAEFFQAAITLAPSFADAYAQLAEIRRRHCCSGTRPEASTTCTAISGVRYFSPFSWQSCSAARSTSHTPLATVSTVANSCLATTHPERAKVGGQSPRDWETPCCFAPAPDWSPSPEFTDCSQ